MEGAQIPESPNEGESLAVKEHLPWANVSKKWTFTLFEPLYTLRSIIYYSLAYLMNALLFQN